MDAWLCHLTGRQYGAFVLADAASGQSPVTPRERGQKDVTVQERPWRGFWHPATNFYEDYACRGTSLIGARKLSPCRILVMGTGAVSPLDLPLNLFSY